MVGLRVTQRLKYYIFCNACVYTVSHKRRTLLFAVTSLCLRQYPSNLAGKKNKLRATQQIYQTATFLVTCVRTLQSNLARKTGSHSQVRYCLA